MLLGYNVVMGATLENLWVPMVYALGPTIVAILSIRHGVGGRETSDIVSATIAAMSIILLWWLGIEAGLTALLVADFAGVWPTICKTFRQPQTEDSTAWAITTLGCAINLVVGPCLVVRGGSVRRLPGSRKRDHRGPRVATQKDSINTRHVFQTSGGYYIYKQIEPCIEHL